MLDESKIIKLSLVCSILGLFLLLIISESISLRNSDISSINSSKLENKIKVKGVIKRVTNKDTVSIINLEDLTGNITVVAFQPKYKFLKQETIEVEGIVKDNYDQIQLEALKIKRF
ncbi:MAG: OB-fold nucleic acid binding domain-containing protein [Candidatus Nanoarchaeia archaeon]|nr:OB-fold nucleic acid binding domain-containing protein [Candidatus Nanoarchaeia archaeon]